MGMGLKTKTDTDLRYLLHYLIHVYNNLVISLKLQTLVIKVYER